MDQTAIVSLLAIGLSLATVVVVRINRREETDAEPFGDVVNVPPELWPVRNRSGGDRIRASGRADTHKVIAHDGSVTKP